MSHHEHQVLQSLDHVAFSNQVSGEPLDLRVSFTASSPESTTTSPRKNSYSLGATCPPSRVDNIEDLVRVLKATTPSTAIESNIAPMPVTISILSSEVANTDEGKQLHKYLVSMASIAHLYTGILLVNQIVKSGSGGELWNVNASNEAIVALSNTANAAYRTMLGPLMGLYSIRNTTASTYNQTVKRSEIHNKFLQEFVGEFGLGREALEQLDSVLTGYVKVVRGLPITREEQSTVDQVFRVNWVERKNITNDDHFPVWKMVAGTRLVHLKIAFETWEEAVMRNKKACGEQREWEMVELEEKDEDVAITMDITVVDAVLNIEEYLRHKDRFENIVQAITGQDLLSFGESINSATVIGEMKRQKDEKKWW